VLIALAVLIAVAVLMVASLMTMMRMCHFSEPQSAQ
jgi:hypothetical protein